MNVILQIVYDIGYWFQNLDKNLRKKDLVDQEEAISSHALSLSGWKLSFFKMKRGQIFFSFDT